MIDNRELSMDDYLAMLRRRLKVILIPALLAPLVGFLISYAFAPKYTSQSLVLVEEQKVPEGYVKPVVTEDLMQRIATVQQRVLTQARLKPMIDKTEPREEWQHRRSGRRNPRELVDSAGDDRSQSGRREEGEEARAG